MFCFESGLDVILQLKLPDDKKPETDIFPGFSPKIFKQWAILFPSAQRIWQSDRPSLFLVLNTNQNALMMVIPWKPDPEIGLLIWDC